MALGVALKVGGEPSGPGGSQVRDRRRLGGRTRGRETVNQNVEAVSSPRPSFRLRAVMPRCRVFCSKWYTGKQSAKPVLCVRVAHIHGFTHRQKD